MSAPLPAGELLARLEEARGPVAGLRAVGSTGPGRVFALELGGEPAFLKEHGQERKFHQERRAYLETLPGLGLRTPELLWSDAAGRALLLSVLEGDGVEGVARPLAEELDLHRQAGAFLRVLHAAEVRDEDPLPLAEAAARRLEAWLPRAGLTGDEVRLARAAVGEGEPLRGARRVPCHRDFQPRNWLAAGGPEGPRLGVLDFEHARPDHPLFDLVKLVHGAWRGRHDRRAAFLEGYGSTPDERELRVVSALHGVATAAWGREHGDPAYRAEGRRVLAELAAGR